MFGGGSPFTWLSTLCLLLWSSNAQQLDLHDLNRNGSVCSRICSCHPDDKPQCPFGVRLIRDGCGCCWICARLSGESCSSLFPCDAEAGLRCLYEGSEPVEQGTILQSRLDMLTTIPPSPTAVGVCWKAQGLPCYLNHTLIPHGAMQQVGCRFHCTCVDGLLKCTDRCSEVESKRPHLSECYAFRGNKSTQMELHLVPPSPTECCRRWICVRVPDSPRVEDFYQPQTPTIQVNDTKPCHLLQPLSSPWSVCDQQCGLGVSFRWVVDTHACQNVTQLRLCFWRPCQTVHVISTTQFVPTLKFVRPAYLSFTTTTGDPTVPVRPSGNATEAGLIVCQSERPIRPRFCNRSQSPQQCCLPIRVRTKQLCFQCSSGQAVKHFFEWIQSCQCFPSPCSDLPAHLLTPIEEP